MPVKIANIPRNELSPYDCHHIRDTFGRHEEVAVQENYSDTDGAVPPIITGLVTGYTESDIIIGDTRIPLANLWWAQKTQ